MVKLCYEELNNFHTFFNKTLILRAFKKIVSNKDAYLKFISKDFYPILSLMNLFYELGEIFSLTCQKNYVFFVQILSPLKEISFESSFRFITIKFSHKLNAYEAKNKFRQTRAWDVLLVLTKVIEKYQFPYRQ